MLSNLLVHQKLYENVFLEETPYILNLTFDTPELSKVILNLDVLTSLRLSITDISNDIKYRTNDMKEYYSHFAKAFCECLTVKDIILFINWSLYEYLSNFCIKPKKYTKHIKYISISQGFTHDILIISLKFI